MRFIEAPTNFYLGARIDPETRQLREDDVVYYDSRDLVTHGVILGMTGSGKSGLAISLLEEAVMDNIPTLIIDPKGDITNMLLAFSDFTPDNFAPWVNPEEAVREGHSLEEHARSEAEQWKNGLAQWGITNERVQTYRRASRFSIYTPGSEAGLRISILQSLAAPRGGFVGNEEFLREQIAGTVTALLALVGISSTPVESREHILLSNIFEYNWRAGVDLTMEQVITQVQTPPFTKLGALDVESVMAEKDRFKLAQALNNIIAAPNFQNWIAGEPINIPGFLFTPEGFPRTTIFYVAHLSDSERQFIVTLLLESVLAWMRTQSGSTSLRALLYIDEVFGMFPPTKNPPTKAPILRLLKQARAFGLGVMVATQNPKDIDYKGLANAGTWFIGKMQTDNDKERVLEGLDSARDATSTLDVTTVSRLIGNLGPREFILHDIHKPETPILMSSRWSMSYLRGPLTRQQIGMLMENQRNLQAAASPAPPSYMAHMPGAQTAPAHNFPTAPSSAGAGAPLPPMPATDATSQPTYSGTVGGAAPSYPTTPQPAPDNAPAGFSPIPPMLSSSVYQFYLPTEYTVEQSIRNWEQWTQQPAVQVETRKRLLYRPSLLAQVNVLFNHKQTASTQSYVYAFVVPNLPRTPLINWGDFVADAFDPHALDPNPFAEAFYAEVSPTLSKGSGFKDLQQNLIDYLALNLWLSVYYNPTLKIYSSLHESPNEFYSRAQALCRQERDQEIDKVAGKYDTKLAALEARAATFDARRELKEEELSARKQEELLSSGEDMLALFKGSSQKVLSRATRLRRYTSTTEDRMGIYEQQLSNIATQLDATQNEMEQALAAVQEKWINISQQNQEVRITPAKKDITPTLWGIGWVPYWDVVVNTMPVILPATSSGLSTAQQ